MAKRVLDTLPRSRGAGRMPPGPRPKPPKRSGPRFTITPSVEKWIRDTILAWPGPDIGWEEVRDRVKKKYPNGVWARQSLARHEVVQKAFQAAKKRLAEEEAHRKAQEHIRITGKAPKPAKPKSGTEEYMRDRIQFLEGENRQLNDENKTLKDRFIRWQRNAFMAGITAEQLDRPVRPIDRGQANE
jgi:hypothetical protein